MNELIPLQPQTINGATVETVSARELHAFLESKQDFSNWINNRIEQYDFVENQDFILVLNQQNKVSNKIIENPKNPKNKGGRPTKEYFLTLDMAKELSMVERTDKGKQARQYFIECERKLRETQAKLAPKTYVEALRTLADEVEAHEQTKQTLAIAEPKAQYFDKLVERNLLTNFTTTAKEFGVKRKDLIDYLLDNGYIYRDQQGNLLPYATHVPHLFEVKEYSKDAHSGVQTLVTPKGRETLRLLLS